MSKFIIKNKSKVSPMDCMDRVKSVISLGKISMHNGVTGYCHVNTLKDCIVICELTRIGTHVFTITNL